MFMARPRQRPQGIPSGLPKADEAYAAACQPGRRRAWSSSNPGNVAARRELTKAILEEAQDRLTSGAALLDVGCGTGWCLEALAAAGAAPEALHGVDVDPARVAAARGRIAGARIEVGEAQSLPYANDSCGVVLMLVVLSSLRRRAHVVAALSEARRVLAPGGVLLVYEPRVPNPLNPRTRVVRDRELDAGGLIPRRQRTLTLVPQLGRRLGPLTRWLHPSLSRVPALCSHRLVSHWAPSMTGIEDGGQISCHRGTRFPPYA